MGFKDKHFWDGYIFRELDLQALLRSAKHDKNWCTSKASPGAGNLKPLLKYVYW